MECYVCTEPAYSLSPCACKNLYLHEDCYAKLLLYNNTRCGICLQDYPLPDIEAPTVYTKSSTDSDDYEPCRGKTITAKCCLQHLLRFLMVFILMNVFKYIFTVHSYSFTIFELDDYAYWFYALLVYFLICLIVKGVHGHND